LAETEEREFTCAKCGHRDRMFVAAQADGKGSAAYGLFAEEAQRKSLEKAAAKMLRTMDFAATRASCPKCGFSSHAAGFWSEHGKWIGGWFAAPVVLGAIGQLFATRPGLVLVGLGLFIGTAAGVYQLLERWTKHKSALRRSSVTFRSQVTEASIEAAVHGSLVPNAVPASVAEATGVPLPLLVERLREHVATTKDAERAELEQLREENRALKAKLSS
jgi:hypothetical protein